MEEIIFMVILHAGDARSNCIKALKSIQLSDYEGARLLLEDASKSINLAHKTQTEMIQKEVRGEVVELSLLLVHAQDHLASAQMIRDIVVGTLGISENFNSRIQNLEKENKS